MQTCRMAALRAKPGPRGMPVPLLVPEETTNENRLSAVTIGRNASSTANESSMDMSSYTEICRFGVADARGREVRCLTWTRCWQHWLTWLGAQTRYLNCAFVRLPQYGGDAVVQEQGGVVHRDDDGNCWQSLLASQGMATNKA